MKITVTMAFVLLGTASGIRAQEAARGFDLAATLTGQAVESGALSRAPRSGADWAGGFRVLVYPTLKVNEHWSVEGAIQTVSRPYYPQDFTSIGEGVRSQVLRATVSYSRTWPGRPGTRNGGGSVSIRAGEMLSAFGSFLTQYDDARNPFTGPPQAYGYYKPVSTLGLAGAEIDVTEGKWDGRLQLVNSSPSNPRSVFAKDQYANWAGGFGYTVKQGLRVGVSGYRGPYLDRQSPYFQKGEANPVDLPASAMGVEAEWAAGHWNARGEWQRFVLPYRAVPTFRESTAYGEIVRTISPRWFVAGRAGYVQASYQSGGQEYDAVVGFRSGPHQIWKAAYTVIRSERNGALDGQVTVQFVATVSPVSLAWR